MQKLDNTQTGPAEIVIGKARTALDFRRPRDVGAGQRLLSVRNVGAGRWGASHGRWQGCGAVGVSGVTSELDAQVAWPGPQQPSNRHGNAPVHGEASVPAPCCRTDRSAVGQAMRQLTRGIAKARRCSAGHPLFCRLVR